MTIFGARPHPLSPRAARPQRWLLCRPTHFAVRYAINAWMDPSAPVNTERALRQWGHLVEVLRGLGHQVDICEGAPELPDMVFAANAATVIGGTAVLTRFAGPERAGEVPRYADWLRAHGWSVVMPSLVNEGEGDLRWTGSVLLCGSGFRTEPSAHAEVAAALGVPAASLELVDPKFYHLDTALAVLGRDTVAYYPGAFSAKSQAVLGERYPDALLVGRAEAELFALNAVSDGRNVVIPAQATGFAAQLQTAGFLPMPVDVSEFAKAGGGAKCCVLTLR